jgi:hypothetical protein
LAKDKELHDTTGKRPPPPLAQDLHLHHSTKQLELLLNTDRAPSTHQLVYVTPNDSLSSAFLFSGRKFRTSIRTLVEKGSKLLNHSERRLWWMNPARMMWPQCQIFLVVIKKYQHNEPMKDLGIPGMIVEESWEDSDKDYNEIEYGKPLVTKQAHAKLMWPLRRLHEWYYLACVYGLQFIEGHVPEAVFKSRIFDQNIKLFELHTIYRLRMVDINMMTVFFYVSVSNIS